MRKLTPRHRQILELRSRGCTYREIAAELGNSPDTVRTLEGAILRRMNARTMNARTMTEACVKYERERAAFEAADLLRQRILQEALG